MTRRKNNRKAARLKRRDGGQVPSQTPVMETVGDTVQEPEVRQEDVAGQVEAVADAVEQEVIDGSTETQAAGEAPEAAVDAKPIKKRGRTKKSQTGEVSVSQTPDGTTKVTISLPADRLDAAKIIARGWHNGSLSQYIRSLLEQDYADHQKLYDEAIDISRKFDRLFRK